MQVSVRARFWRVTFLALCLLGSTGATSEPSITGKNLVDLAETASKAVCRVVVYDDHGAPLGQGSAFMLDGGVLVTCYHVLGVPGATRATVEFDDGKAIPVEGFVAADRDRDLILVRLTAVPAGTGVLALTEPDVPKVGTPVLAIGYPLGLARTVSQGIITALPKGSDIKRSLPADTIGEDDRLIQTDAALYPGNSGGPMLDPDGAVLAIVSSGHPQGESLHWGVPSIYLQPLLASTSGSARPLSELQPPPFAGNQPRPILPPRGVKVSLNEVRNAISKIDRMTKCKRCAGTGTIKVTRITSRTRGPITTKDAKEDTRQCPDCAGRGFVANAAVYGAVSDLAELLAYMRTDATTIRRVEVDKMLDAAGKVLDHVAFFEMPSLDANAAAQKIAAPSSHVGEGICFSGEFASVVSSLDRDYYLVKVHGAYNAFVALVLPRATTTFQGQCFVAGVIGGHFKGSDEQSLALVWPVYVQSE